MSPSPADENKQGGTIFSNRNNLRVPKLSGHLHRFTAAHRNLGNPQTARDAFIEVDPRTIRFQVTALWFAIVSELGYGFDDRNGRHACDPYR